MFHQLCLFILFNNKLIIIYIVPLLSTAIVKLMYIMMRDPQFRARAQWMEYIFPLTKKILRKRMLIKIQM